MKKAEIYIFTLTPILILILILILIPHTFIAGHGFGTSVEAVEGKYLADIGYDSFLIEAGSPVRFDFTLFFSNTPWRPNGDGTFASESANPVDFDNLWVRIEKSDSRQGTIFATGIKKSSFGPTTLLFSFPEEGSYTLFARFQDEKDASIVEVKAPLFVERGEQSPASRKILLWIGISALIGLALGMFLPRLKM